MVLCADGCRITAEGEGRASRSAIDMQFTYDFGAEEFLTCNGAEKVFFSTNSFFLVHSAIASNFSISSWQELKKFSWVARNSTLSGFKERAVDFLKGEIFHF